MKLFSLSVLYKGDPKAVLLSAAYDVSSFSFFQRTRWAGRAGPGRATAGRAGGAGLGGGRGLPGRGPRGAVLETLPDSACHASARKERHGAWKRRRGHGWTSGPVGRGAEPAF